MKSTLKIISIFILGAFFIFGESGNSVEGAFSSDCEDITTDTFSFSCYYECNNNRFSQACNPDCDDSSDPEIIPLAPKIPCDPECDDSSDPESISLLPPCDPECDDGSDPEIIPLTPPIPCDPECDDGSDPESITLLPPCDPECDDGSDPESITLLPPCDPECDDGSNPEIIPLAPPCCDNGFSASNCTIFKCLKLNYNKQDCSSTYRLDELIDWKAIPYK